MSAAPPGRGSGCPLTSGSAALADPASYRPGDTMVFRRAYKRLGVREGAEGTVAAVDPGSGLVQLADARGRIADWRPGSLAGLSGGVELFRGAALHVIAAIETGDPLLATEESLYAALGCACSASCSAALCSPCSARPSTSSSSSTVSSRSHASSPGLRTRCEIVWPALLEPALGIHQGEATPGLRAWMGIPAVSSELA